MPAGDGCFLVSPWKNMADMTSFFICYRYKVKFCNWVQNPSHQLWLSNAFPIKLCNAHANVLLHLNKQIMDWRPVGQRLFFLWENVCPASSLIADFHCHGTPPQPDQSFSLLESRAQSPCTPQAWTDSDQLGVQPLFPISWSTQSLLKVLQEAMLNPLFTVRKEETNFREVKILQSLCTQE